MIVGVEPGDPGDRRQRLRNMHGADHHQPHRRNEDGEETALAGVVDEAALARSQRRVERLGERIGRDGLGRDEALLAVGEPGDQRAGAPLAPRRVHRLENFQAHQSTRST